MVKQVIVEEQVLECFGKHIGQEKCSAGIIVGKTTSNRDYIIDLIKCPMQVVDEKAVSWKYLKDVDGSWVAGHAAQIISSLPGGVNVIGLFLIAKSSDGKLVLEKMKHMVYQMYKLVSKTVCENYSITYSNEESLFWTTLHVSVENGSIVNMRQFDVKDNNDVGRPVDPKKSQIPMQWDCLETRIFIDKWYENLPADDELETLKACMKDICDGVLGSVVTVENKQRPNEEILNPANVGNIGKTSKKQKTKIKPSDAKTYTCEVFIPSVQSKLQHPLVEHDFKHLHLSGTVTGKAFVAPSSTVGEAIAALKCDLVRSVLQRFEIIFDELKDTDRDVVNNPLCLPRRVYCSRNSANRSILYSEYLSPDEPVEDCLERYRDNLDLIVTAEDISMERSVEQFAPTESNSEVLPSHSIESKETAAGSSATNLFIAIGASVVAVLGWLFSDLFVNEN